MPSATILHAPSPMASALLFAEAAAISLPGGFDGSKLGIELHAVEITPAGDLLVLDSINSNIYRVQLPLSPCEHALPPTTPLSFFRFFSLHGILLSVLPLSMM